MGNTKKPDYIFDISQEVANKGGGVYTVLSTKAHQMVHYYGSKYYLVGNLDYANRGEIEIKSPPKTLAPIFELLRKKKIKCLYAKWLVSGSPSLILIDCSDYKINLHAEARKIEKLYRIPNIINLVSKRPNIKNNFMEKMKWALGVRYFFEQLIKTKPFSSKKIVCNFNDTTLTTPADLTLNTKIGIVVTMHSTGMGRGLSIKNQNIHSLIGNYKFKNKDALIKQKLETLHPLQKVNFLLDSVNIKYADILTAVSENTSKEIMFFHGRSADKITPNGLNMFNYPSFEERAVLHDQSKKRIYRFLNAYFCPYYSVDVNDSLLFFTSGRYEMVTKGYEIFFKSLGELNKKLITQNYEKNIFVFIFIMQDDAIPKKEVIENIAVYDVLEHEIEKEEPYIRNRIINALLHRHDLNHEQILSMNFLVKTKKLIQKFKRQDKKLPPICSLDSLKSDDPLLRKLYQCGLRNRREDKVRIIFYPAPLSVADGCLSMEYNEVIAGMHLGVFPSLYEPWGYTPVETAASTVMSVTTDFSGFGNFILKNQIRSKGVFVLKAMNKKKSEIANELTKILYKVTKMTRYQRMNLKIEARKIAIQTGWENLIHYYLDAHSMAVEKSRIRHIGVENHIKNKTQSKKYSYNSSSALSEHFQNQ